MSPQKASRDGILILSLLVSLCLVHQCLAVDNANLVVDASDGSGRKVPETLFGIFFEEINHAGTGGLWAELVSNRGFEAGGQNTPSDIDPWSVIGDQSSVLVSTELSSCFQRNKVALKLQVLCNRRGCPDGGVGIYNPGFWGMNIEEGKVYKLVLYVRSTGAIDLTVSLTDRSGLSSLATAQIVASASKVSKWTKMEVSLKAVGTNHNSRLQLTTNKKGVIWLDQVSLMPSDTYKEINHAGTGGLWAELVSNRGFEAGGQNTPSNIDPWFVIGDESSVVVSTERSSCIQRNKVALKLQVLCNSKGCPDGGVGIYNPGFWNIEEGKVYKLVLYVRSTGAIDLTVSLTDRSGLSSLATAQIVASASKVSKWTKMEVSLKAVGTNHNSRLQLTTNRKGVIWLDQVSLMPSDTYKGHGFRNQHIEMIQALEPKFLRFPGGTYVEGQWLRNAFRWNDTVGPWEERSGHYNDVWLYWTDDGLGFYELLQLSEDLGALPVWVFNIGISRNDVVDPSDIFPFVEEALDGIEFARGDPKSKWGSVRAGMGHPEPFDLRYVALGNEDCDRPNYKANYLKFYSAIRQAYPDMQMISNCDGSSGPLDHPAELYDFHVYTSANNMFSMAHQFDHTPRGGPKAFVSEYAVWKADAGTGSLLAALGEAGFLIGVETNSDVVSMASYAPLFVNSNDRQWNPDAIVFDSYQIFGTPSYYMQQFFIESSGATLLNSSLQSNISSNIVASAITWQNSDKKEYLRIKVVNFGNNAVSLKISISGLSPNAVFSGLTRRELTSGNVMDENSFLQPDKVVPKTSPFEGSGQEMTANLSPNSFTSFDLLKDSTSAQSRRTRAGSKHRRL